MFLLIRVWFLVTLESFLEVCQVVMLLIQQKVIIVRRAYYPDHQYSGTQPSCVGIFVAWFVSPALGGLSMTNITQGCLKLAGVVIQLLPREHHPIDRIK
jgi:hypothetical protein